MALQVMDPNSDFAYLKQRATNLALENKRRNEAVSEILRPPPHPFAREEPVPDFQKNTFNAAPEPDEDKTRKAPNPFGRETTAEKAARQQREAEEDIRRYREERQRKLLEKNREKKMDLEMLQTYYPWGQPGHGAPLGSDLESQRKRKFLPGDGGRQDATQDLELGLGLNRPGHGAPIRTESGRLITQLPGDPALRFRGRDAPGKRGRDPSETLRYRNPDEQSYARELETHMQQQTQQREIDRAYELQEELNSLQYDPYGKPGSGAPNAKLPQTLQHLDVQHQQLHQRRLEAAELADDREAWGWEADNRAGLAMRQPLREADQPPWYQRRDIADTQSAPNPRSELPPLQQQQQQQRHRQEQSDQSQYTPFGRPGAGAPLRGPDGRLISSVYGATAKFEEPPGEKQRRAEAAKMYSQELERGLIEQSLNKRLEIQQRRAPVDSPIAEQLARGTVGKPSRDPRTGVLLDQHLSSSDVTHVNYKTPRHQFRSVTGYQALPEFTEAAEGYGSELERAAVERAAARRIDRAREVHEAHRHAQAFDRMFGRPGAGAPGPQGARKVNLDRALFSQDDTRNEFKKPVDHVTQIRSTAYVRNPTGSTHSNGYEAASDGQMQPSYSLQAPYAVQRPE